MQQATQGRKLFAVALMKHDQQHIIVQQTENYDEARATWNTLVDKWTRALKEQHPFVLDNNIEATAFDPKLVYEITIKATELSGRVNMNNPYTQDMLQNGFSESFGRFAKGANNSPIGTEVLDSGYKF